MSGQKILKRMNLLNGHVNEFSMKFGCTVAYQDYDKKQIYCLQKRNSGKYMIRSINYDGNYVKNITSVNGSNVPAIAVFNNFFYQQRNGENTISEINLLTGAVSRNIFLPTQFFRLTDLAIIDASIYQTGNQVD